MRNISDVADKIIKVIDEKCDFDEERVASIIERIEKVKRDSSYRAPELSYMDWENLSYILSQNFEPVHSRWETEIMIIFNNLNDKVTNDFNR